MNTKHVKFGVNVLAVALATTGAILKQPVNFYLVVWPLISLVWCYVAIYGSRQGN